MGTEQPSTATRYLEAANARISDLEALTRLHEVGSRCVRADNDFDACLAAILEAAIYITAADRGCLQLLDPPTGALVIKAQRGLGARFLEFFSRVDIATGVAHSSTLRSGSRVMIEDVTRSEHFAGSAAAEVLLTEGVGALQYTPLISSSERVFGTICTHFARPTRLGEREARFVDLLARQAADYVERKETERLVAVQHLRLERIIGQVGSFIAHCNREFRYVFVNKPCADFFGKPVEMIIGRSVPEVIGEAAFQVIRPYIERVLAGERVEYEAEIPYAGAGPRHVHVIYVPDLDHRSSIGGWIATINDITQRKQLDGQLRTAG